MGFRFRRSVKLLPGVRLNFSTRGISTSLGGRGATLNLGRRGARATFGLPGTGLSYTTKLSGASGPGPAAASAATQGSPLLGWITLGILVLALGMCMSGRSETSAPPVPTPAAQPLTAPAAPSRLVAGNGVNCRAAPDKAATVLTKFDRGASVSILGQASGWTKIAHMGGDCWISNALLSP